nr:Nudix hydrolase YfcD [Raoultella sp. NCTC 9187]
MAEQNDLASTEWVDIVNENNEVIAQSSREQMRAQCLRIVQPTLSFMMGWAKFWCSVVPR